MRNIPSYPNIGMMEKSTSSRLKASTEEKSNEDIHLVQVLAKNQRQAASAAHLEEKLDDIKREMHSSIMPIRGMGRGGRGTCYRGRGVFRRSW